MYSYTGVEFAVPGAAATVTLYSLQNGIPALKDRAVIPNDWNLSNDNGIITEIPLVGPYNQVTEYNVTGGSIATTTFTLNLPDDADFYAPDTTFVVGNRMFVSIVKNDGQGAYILTYDISMSPPSLLGSIDARSLGFYTSGNLLFGELGGMDIYNISSELPEFESHLDDVNALQLVGTQVLADTEEQGCQIVDISNPSQPQVTSIVFDGVAVPIAACGSGNFVGNYVYSAEGAGGITVYDGSETGGPITQTYLYGGPHGLIAAYDMLLDSNTLYVATSSESGPALEIYDVSTIPATRLGEYVNDDPQLGGYAVQAAGQYAYFGIGTNISVLDVSQPSSPSLVGTVAASAISLATAGNTLYAGTTNNTLVVMNITNPEQPAIVETIPLPDLPIKVRVSGNLLMVADNAAGLIMYNISNPQAPVLLSELQGFTLAADVAVQGTKAYVAADVDGLGIVDISNPSHPVLLSKTGLSSVDPFYVGNPPNEALTVTVNDGLVYVGTLYDSGLVFGLDCSNPLAPRIVSAYPYGGAWSASLVFNGTELFVGGLLYTVYPVAQANVVQPYDSINQYFPPAALQAPSRPSLRKALPAPPRRPGGVQPNKFHRF